MAKDIKKDTSAGQGAAQPVQKPGKGLPGSGQAGTLVGQDDLPPGGKKSN